MDIDLMSLSSHKVYGPKGIGAIFIRRMPKVDLVPLIHGGGHERGYRSGTLATHQIVGMGEAFRLAKENFDTEIPRLQGAPRPSLGRNTEGRRGKGERLDGAPRRHKPQRELRGR